MDPNDENQRTQQVLIALLPLTIGWFALNVPSGLSLYYFANSVITTGQQVWLRKLGGGSRSLPGQAQGSLPLLHGNLKA